MRRKLQKDRLLENSGFKCPKPQQSRPIPNGTTADPSIQRCFKVVSRSFFVTFLASTCKKTRNPLGCLWTVARQSIRPTPFYDRAHMPGLRESSGGSSFHPPPVSE